MKSLTMQWQACGLKLTVILSCGITRSTMVVMVASVSSMVVKVRVRFIYSQGQRMMQDCIQDIEDVVLSLVNIFKGIILS